MEENIRVMQPNMTEIWVHSQFYFLTIANWDQPRIEHSAIWPYIQLAI